MAVMMVQFYRAKIARADKFEGKKEVTNSDIDGNGQSCESCYACSVFCLFCHAFFVIVECYNINKFEK